MNKAEITNKGIVTGAIIGIILFAVIGLLPSSFIGGVIGLKIASYLLGMPAGTELLSRTVVGLTMVFGIAVTGFIFVVGASMIGWLFGHLGMAIRNRRELKTV